MSKNIKNVPTQDFEDAVVTVFIPRGVTRR
jgi:hypothetical protein